MLYPFHILRKLQTNKFSNICKQIHSEKAKPTKNVELINGMIQEYFHIKECTYKLVSELLITSEELNTSLELMHLSVKQQKMLLETIRWMHRQFTKSTRMKLSL